MRNKRLSLINALSVALALVMALGMASAVITARPSSLYVEARP